MVYNAALAEYAPKFRYRKRQHVEQGQQYLPLLIAVMMWRQVTDPVQPLPKLFVFTKLDEEVREFFFLSLVFGRKANVLVDFPSQTAIFGQ